MGYNIFRKYVISAAIWTSFLSVFYNIVSKLLKQSEFYASLLIPREKNNSWLGAWYNFRPCPKNSGQLLALRDLSSRMGLKNKELIWIYQAEVPTNWDWAYNVISWPSMFWVYSDQSAISSSVNRSLCAHLLPCHLRLLIIFYEDVGQVGYACHVQE